MPTSAPARAAARAWRGCTERLASGRTAAIGARCRRARQPSRTAPDAPESKLFVGINIELKGVEICDCDVLVIEGHVEATVHSKAMEIAKPGTLKGNAQIDIAEIHGDFVGELTVRNRARDSRYRPRIGTIRYGKLIVAEGGQITGDIKRLEAGEQRRPRPRGRSRPGDSESTSGAVALRRTMVELSARRRLGRGAAPPL